MPSVSAHAVSWACALICGLRWVLQRRAQHLSQIAWNCLGSPHVGYKHLPVLIYGLQVISSNNHSTVLNQKYSGLIRRCLAVSRLSSPNLKLNAFRYRHHSAPPPQLSACGSIRNAVPGLLSETRHANTISWQCANAGPLVIKCLRYCWLVRASRDMLWTSFCSRRALT